MFFFFYHNPHKPSRVALATRSYTYNMFLFISPKIIVYPASLVKYVI